jgi:hypothetical protein
MKRVLTVLLVAALGVLAWVMPAPEATVQPSVTSTTNAVASLPSHSTCPWVYSDGLVDSYLVAQSGDPADLRFTFPIAGEVQQTVEESQPASAATALTVSSAISQGIDPAVVEFSSSPSAAGVVETGDGVLSVDVCPSTSSKVWHLTGGSTLDGQSLELVLFNPFPEDASVSISVRSEVGVEPMSDLETVTVGGRSSRVFDLGAELSLRESLSVAVDMKEGSVTPVMVFGEGSDVATWTNGGQAEQWDFPVVDPGGFIPTLFLSNDTSDPVDYQVDAYTTSGTQSALLTGSIDGNAHVALSLGDLVESPFGVRVTASSPVAATVISGDGTRVAATTGAAEPTTHWMLPGYGLGGPNRVWVMNSGTETATVTYQLVDAGGALGGVDKIAVPPATIRSLVGLPLAATGMEIDSNVPVSVAWTVERPDGLGMAPGVPIP